MPSALRLAEPATTQAVAPRLGPRVRCGRLPRLSQHLRSRARSRARAAARARFSIRGKSASRIASISRPVRYWYSVVAVDRNGVETSELRAARRRRRSCVVSRDEAVERRWIADGTRLRIGDEVDGCRTIRSAPTTSAATCSRGSCTARACRCSSASSRRCCSSCFGVALRQRRRVSRAAASITVLMRFADFVVALPFLLFMILFKIAFGIGPGESGVFPMLVALVRAVAGRRRRGSCAARSCRSGTRATSARRACSARARAISCCGT